MRECADKFYGPRTPPWLALPVPGACLDGMRLDALDASMQPPCHNGGIRTQYDSIKILNLKHSVTIQLSEPERRSRPNLLLLSA
jgi:hypothetical protein